MSSRCALLSVSDKTGLVDFARGLVECGFLLLSTGGTSKALSQAGIPVRDVSDYTGFPEMMDGRVKTLHPKVHGGLLMVRGNGAHEASAKTHGIERIDLVCVNLYPFEQTTAKPDCSLEDAVENIDIGGPAMLRSSAKNYRFVTVVTDPSDYARVLSELKSGGDTTPALRERLALKVFALTSRYDGAIHSWLSQKLTGQPARHFSFSQGRTLRYGENPHQAAWIFPTGETPSAPSAKQLHGKEMSYNNYLDSDACLETALEFLDAPSAVVVKHGNPCGIATASSLARALELAWEGDIVSAFGSVITLTRTVDLKTAEFLKGKFVEVLLAPAFEPDALAFLKAKSKDIRLLELGALSQAPKGDERRFRFVRGALLSQTPDDTLIARLESVTRAKLSAEDEPLARFACKAVKHLKSNAVTVAMAHEAGHFMLLGMGTGQPNRVDAIRKLARTKAEENLLRLFGSQGPARLSEALLASEAFFPLPDSIEELHAMGIRKLVQPGGSVKDGDVIAACDRLGVAMAFTGTRHFLH